MKRENRRQEGISPGVFSRHRPPCHLSQRFRGMLNAAKGSGSLYKNFTSRCPQPRQMSSRPPLEATANESVVSPIRPNAAAGNRNRRKGTWARYFSAPRAKCSTSFRPNPRASLFSFPWPLSLSRNGPARNEQERREQKKSYAKETVKCSAERGLRAWALNTTMAITFHG